MSENPNSVVQAVQESVVNLLELVSQAACEQNGQELEALREDAKTTVLMLIAALVLADDKYAAGERAFVNQLVGANQKSGGAARYLNEYAERWETAAMQVPRFFQAGIDHDNRYHTELAQGMIREIQFVGNNACVIDGHYEATENRVVRNYISFLELYLAEWRAQNAAPPKEAAEGWSSV